MRTTYQNKPEQLKRQQEILKVLGFYKGKLDGIWGPKSIAAMKDFEASAAFKPCIPNHGMPLSYEGRLPSGITKGLDRRVELLYHPLLETLVEPTPTPAPKAKVEETTESKDA
jgi:hypothetical protein